MAHPEEQPNNAENGLQLITNINFAPLVLEQLPYFALPVFDLPTIDLSSHFQQQTDARVEAMVKLLKENDLLYRSPISKQILSIIESKTSAFLNEIIEQGITLSQIHTSNPSANFCVDDKGVVHILGDDGE